MVITLVPWGFFIFLAALSSKISLGPKLSHSISMSESVSTLIYRFGQVKWEILTWRIISSNLLNLNGISSMISRITPSSAPVVNSYVFFVSFCR